MNVSPAAHEGTLYLARIDENFNPETDVALDPWCFLGHEDVYPDWQQLDFIDPFPGLKDIEEGHAIIRPWLVCLVRKLTVELNALHGTTHSEDFWRIILITWLAELAQRVWKHYLLIEQLVKTHGKRPMRATVWTESVSWPFGSVDQFFECLMHSPEFNWWIDSQILAVLAPSNWMLNPATERPDPAKLVVPRDVRTVPKGFGRLIRRIKLSLGHTDIVGTSWVGAALAVFANLLPCHPSHHRIQPEADFVPEDVFPEKFLQVFEKILQATMPKAYREEFPEYVKMAQTHPTRPGRLRLGTLSFWNEEEKFVTAFAKEAGEKTIQTQHGGTYGIAAIHLKPAEIEYRNDVFFSWGWSKHGDYQGRFIPMPSPLLSRAADAHRETSSELIIVSNGPRYRRPRIDQRPKGIDFVRCAQDTLSIIGGLDKQVRERTFLRPYLRATVDFDIRELTKDKYPEVPFLTGGLHQRLMGCRMAILQAPGTTINIVMAANVPTVCVWNKDFFLFCPQAQPYFDALEDSKILFYDPAAAAAHINAIWEDVDGWWQSDSVQSARQNWCDQFAHTDRFWWWQWMKALVKLAREC